MDSLIEILIKIVIRLFELSDININTLIIFVFSCVFTFMHYKLNKNINSIKENQRKNAQKLYISATYKLIDKENISLAENNDNYEDYLICKNLGTNGIVDRAREELENRYNELCKNRR